MYSWEIEQILKKYNNYIGGDVLLSVINPHENPQLRNIAYRAYDSSYYMEDDKGKQFHFKVMTYEEAKEKGFVKVKKK